MKSCTTIANPSVHKYQSFNQEKNYWYHTNIIQETRDQAMTYETYKVVELINM